MQELQKVLPMSCWSQQKPPVVTCRHGYPGLFVCVSTNMYSKYLCFTASHYHQSFWGITFPVNSNQTLIINISEMYDCWYLVIDE